MAALGLRFEYIRCTGVLHHLADPEAGWAALAAVLRPGGAMSVMLYSRVANMIVLAARRLVRDLMDAPVTDDILREVRRRVMAAGNEHASSPMMRFVDFSTLAGTYDLLMHRHVDPFDVPRIERAMQRLGLSLLRFNVPDAFRERYLEQYPHDGQYRDFAAWHRFEVSNPFVFRGHEFWCQKPVRDENK